ncbi:Ig-like domain-containing protein [Comamonas testosteroni]|uniref:Ig-like domain-containing protein n=1 Tax=Comamonas testosteroni TaxID=285 RepID=UPI003899B98B
MTRKSRPFWNRLTQAMKAPAVQTDAPQRLQPSSAVRPLALEQRFMFDGAAAVDVAHAATDAAAAEHAVDAASALRHALTAEAQRSTEASPSSAQRQEVVFVDGQVANIGELLAGLSSNAEVVILDASKDGLQQMADYLQGRSGIDAIHLLSHGADGAVQVGKLWLNSANLAEHRTALESIGSTLSADGDLLLYGCDIGLGEKGQTFLDQLAAITRADVAASTDRTGAAALGGNWTLEAHTGSIETSRPWASDSGPDYADLLALPSATQNLGNTYWTNNTGANTVDGFTLTEATGATRASSANSIYYSTGVVQDGSGNYYYQLTWTADHVDLGKFDLDGMVIQSFGGNYRLDFSAVSGGNAVSQSFTYSGAQGPLPVDINSALFNDISAFTVRVTNLSGATSVANMDLQQVILTDLKGPNADPVLGGLNGKTASYTEDSGATLIDASGVATVTDSDSANFDGGQLSVAISSGGQSLEDVLGIRNQGTGAGEIGVSGANVTYGGVVIGSYTGGSGGNNLVVTFNSAATAAGAQALVRNLTYLNSNGFDPSTTARTLSVTVTDGDGGTSASASVALSVVAVNDAPVLSPANSVVSFTENGTSSILNPGLTLVDDGSSFQRATVAIADVRSGDVLTFVSQNSFFMSYNSSTGTLTITGAGNAAELQAALRSVGFSSNSDNPTFGGTDNSRQINFTVTDSAGADSNLVTAQVSIIAVNDAPTLSGGPYVWAANSEDVTSQTTTVGNLLAGLSYADADGPGGGIALTTSSGHGTWQYSTDGTTWTNVGAVSSTSALLLSASTQLRYVPDGSNGETATLSFRAWDQSIGTASSNGTRTMADTSVNGGSTAFSTGIAQASLSVSSVNDAPVLTPVSPTLPGLTDGSTDNVGVQVSSLYGSNNTDVDNAALKGIAVTGLNSSNGTWQYSIDGGASWQDTGAVSAASALLLRSSDRVRFVPDGINGTTASFTFLAWDQSGATAGMQGSKANASGSGGSTAFSIGSDTASVTVTAVNDAPTMTSSSGSASWVEGNNVTSTPVVIDSGVTLADPDGPNLLQATVSVANYQMGEDVLAFTNNPATMGNITASFDAATGTLILSSAGNQASLAQWQAALRSVTYNNLSDSPITATRTIQFQVTDGGGLSASAVTRSVTLTAVDDSPVISAPASTQVIEDSASVISQISISDSDSTSGTVTLSVGSGSLSAVSAAGVTAGGTSSALTLTGSLANINSFIAGNRVTYITAANATADVTLSISVDTGSATTDSTTMTLNVSPVNDAPVVTVPGSIAVTEDVSSSLSGISFSDVDAGTGTVSATFSVASGALTATTGGGVNVLNSGAGLLTLTGTLSDINAFVAAGNVFFQTAPNQTSSVLLMVSINDNGNSGGSAQTDTKVVTLVVNAVNDAPVNNVPGSQSMLSNGSLVFSAGQGNQISISDVDAGGGVMHVTLTAANGTISLSSSSGLVFLVGTGTGDGSMTFTGTLASINAALNGMTFLSTAGYYGNAALQITSNDLGMTGAGGAQTDFDTIQISVEQPNPQVLGVDTSTPDGSYKVGDQIQIQVQFDQSVFVNTSGGTPTLLLETGAIDRSATYVSGSGSNTLTFVYIVQAGDLSADLNYASTTALSLNGAQIRNGANEVAILTLPNLSGSDSLASHADLVVDGVVPTVTSVSVPASGTYVAGQSLDFTVNFSENVTVDATSGIPRIAVTFDTGGTVFAQYLRGSGGSALVFRLVVASGQLDSNGITLGSSIQANGGSLSDAAGNNIIASLNSVASTSGVLVDAVVPTVSSVSVPAGAPYNAGDTLTFVVNASEAVVVNGIPRLLLDIGGSTVFANLVSGSGTSTLVFQYTVQPGDNDADGISVNGLSANGATLRDVAGNNMNLTLNSVSSTSGVIVDTSSPSATIVVDEAALVVGETSLVTITFSEAISGLDLTDFNVEHGALSNLTSSDGGITWTATLTPTVGVTDTSNLITLDNTGYADAAGNTGTGTTESNNYSIDTQRPTATIVVADTALQAGESTTVTITFSEAVDGFDNSDLSVGGGSLSTVTSSDGGITWTATFTPTVNLESTGSLITLNNTGVTDKAGNVGVGSTHSNTYGIDTQRPTATIVVSHTALAVGETTTVTITFSEAVDGFDNSDLSVGGGTLSAVSSSDGGITWTATFTPTVNLESTGNLITLNNTGVTDKAGNVGVGSTYSNTYGIDTQRPTATIVVSDTALAVGETTTVTITFSEAVDGFDNSDLSVSGGSLSAVSSSDGGVTWMATFTPTAHITATSNLITLNNASVTDKAGNAGVGSTVSNAYAIDTARPTATIVVADTALQAGESTTVTITFSEAVDGFDNSDLSVSGGTLSAVTSSDGGVTWTATFTPTVNLESTGSLITLSNAGVTDKAGNAGVGSTVSNAYAIDTARPTATIVVADTALQAGESTTVTITFSEAVNDFTNADLSVSGGTLSAVSSSDSGVTWTATFTPTANVESTVNRITLNNAGVTDKAGNAGVGTTDSNNYAIDTQRPTATIVVTDTTLAVGESSTVTITFSEAVSGLTTTDFTVANGTLSNLSSGDGGTTWTATLTPTVGITDTSNLITLDNSGYVDVAGNTGSGTTDSNSYAIDTQRPTATIVVADSALKVGETSLVTITFSEAVTGLELSDFIVEHGALSHLTSGDGGLTWTAILTPTAGITDTSNVITLSNTGYVDAAGNSGAGTTDSNHYAIDTQRPTATIVVTDSALKIGETTLVTITFSEAVSGLTTADFTVANGTLSNLSSSDGGLTWTAMLTPTAGITDTSNVITLDNSGYVDAAGNAGSGTTDSNSYAIDTQRPTATIVVTDSALKIGETTLATITFSEAVSGLTSADFTVANGTLSNLSSSDGGITWTATLTPTVGITDTSNVITLDNNGYVDAAGNTGAGSTDSNNYAIDTQRPTATIVVADNALKVGETSLVIITFSEAVNGFSNADLSVANGTLSAVSSSDGGITWTATFTPTAGITQASNQITLNNSAYADAAGNSGKGTTASNIYAIDTLDPVAPEITLDQATLVNGRQVSPTGLVFISGLETGGSWQYSLDNGVSWLEGRGNSLQLPGLGAFSLWVQQRDAAGNVSSVTSLSGVVEPLVPPAVHAPFAFAVSNSSDGLGLAPFQPSEVPEPNADFLHSASMMLGSVSRDTGVPRQDSWSEYGLPQSIAGVNDWMWAPLFAPAESNHSGIDPATEQFSVSTGASILDLKPALLASDSPWDIASLRFSFADRQELPGWVRLDRQSGQLTIHAPKDLSTTLVLQIKVSDGKGHESVRTVKVVIGEARATSSAPAGRAGLSEKMANAANQQAGKRMSMYVHG